MRLMCTICTDLLEEDEHLVTTRCGHIFHHQCLDRWCSESRDLPESPPNCPQCREPMTQGDFLRVFPSGSEDPALSQLRRENEMLQQNLSFAKDELQFAKKNVFYLEVKLHASKNYTKTMIYSYKNIKQRLQTELDTVKKKLASAEQTIVDMNERLSNGVPWSWFKTDRGYYKSKLYYGEKIDGEGSSNADQIPKAAAGVLNDFEDLELERIPNPVSTSLVEQDSQEVLPPNSITSEIVLNDVAIPDVLSIISKAIPIEPESVTTSTISDEVITSGMPSTVTPKSSQMLNDQTVTVKTLEEMPPEMESTTITGEAAVTMPSVPNIIETAIAEPQATQATTFTETYRMTTPEAAVSVPDIKPNSESILCPLFTQNTVSIKLDNDYENTTHATAENITNALETLQPAIEALSTNTNALSITPESTFTKQEAQTAVIAVPTAELIKITLSSETSPNLQHPDTMPTHLQELTLLKPITPSSKPVEKHCDDDTKLLVKIQTVPTLSNILNTLPDPSQATFIEPQAVQTKLERVFNTSEAKSNVELTESEDMLTTPMSPISKLKARLTQDQSDGQVTPEIDTIAETKPTIKAIQTEHEEEPTKRVKLICPSPKPRARSMHTTANVQTESNFQNTTSEESVGAFKALRDTPVKPRPRSVYGHYDNVTSIAQDATKMAVVGKTPIPEVNLARSVPTPRPRSIQVQRDVQIEPPNE